MYTLERADYNKKYFISERLKKYKPSFKTPPFIVSFIITTPSEENRLQVGPQTYLTFLRLSPQDC